MLLKDNSGIKKVKRGEKIPYGYYKIFLYGWKNKGKGDYHFIRQDNTGQWSHKDGITIAKKLKEKTPDDYMKKLKNKNKNIKYSICGYYAVPIKGKKNLGSLYFL